MKSTLNIMVPVDFSHLSREAFGRAAEIAKQFGASLMVLHVVEGLTPSPFYLEGSLPDAKGDVLEMRLEMERELERLLAEERARGISIRSLISFGSAEKEIVDMAKRFKIDLIVMSTHGWTGISHFILGSVAEKVVRRAPCPVLTLNPNVLSAPRGEEPPGALAPGQLAGKPPVSLPLSGPITKDADKEIAP